MPTRTTEIVFRLAQRRLALPLSQVREVILPGPLIRVPRAGKCVVGAMNVRGRLVLVVDGGLLLGGEPSRSGTTGDRILVLDPRRLDLGIWVSEVLQIAQLGDDGDAPRVQREMLLDSEDLARRIGRLFDAPEVSLVARDSSP
jgi:purine-binding chemotaxis protein CheW